MYNIILIIMNDAEFPEYLSENLVSLGPLPPIFGCFGGGGLVLEEVSIVEVTGLNAKNERQRES